MSEKVFATVLLRSNAKDFSSSEKVRAADNLLMKGFIIITKKSHSEIDISAPRALFEEIFQTKLEKKERIYMAVTPITIPESLSKEIERVTLQ